MLSKYSPIYLLLFALLIRALYFLKTGVIHGGDTEFYLNFAKLIAEHKTIFGITDHPFYYSLYPLLLLLFQFNEQLIIIFQIILSAFSTATLYLIGSHVFSKHVGIIAATIHILSWELFQWDVYILTDSIVVSLMIATCYFLIQSLRTKHMHWWLFTISAMLLLAFARPASLPFLIIVFVFILTNLRSTRLKFWITLTAIILFGYLFYFFAHSGSLSLPFFLQFYTNEFMRGEIIHHRIYLPITWTTSLTFGSLVNALDIILARIGAFWLPFIQTFSWSHIIINIAYFIPLYMFSFYFCVRQKRGSGIKKEIVFLVSIVIVYWLFQSMTEIDYDWRYRLPVLPFLTLIAAAGFDLFIKKHAQTTKLFSKNT